MFINYNVEAGFSIDSFRSLAGYANSGVGGLVHGVLSGKAGSCPLDGAIVTICDGLFWDETEEVQCTLDSLYDLIIAHEMRGVL